MSNTPVFNITDYQDLAHKMTRTPAHLHSASKGGKVPGTPRANRKYPFGKPKDEKAKA